MPGQPEPLFEARSPEEGPAAAYVLPFLEEVHAASHAAFRKLANERQWSRAFRAIDQQLTEPPPGLVDGPGPVYQTWPDQIRDDLVALPPEGQRAFRLFYDAKAQRRWRDLPGEDQGQERRAALEILASSFFTTEVGDDAAWALAQHALQASAPARCARLCRAILSHHVDTNLDRFEVTCLLLRSLAEAGLMDELLSAGDLALARYPDQTLVWDEKPIPLPEALARWENQARARDTFAAETVPDWKLSDGQIRWSQALSRILSMRSNNGLPAVLAGSAAPSNESLSSRPASLVHAGRLFLNQSGLVIALDLETGEPAQRAGNLGEANGWIRPPDPFLVPLAEDRILASGPFKSQGDQSSGLSLSCYAAADLSEVWSSQSHGALSKLLFVGEPLPSGDQILGVARRAGSRELSLVILQSDNGDLLGEIPLGTPVARDQSSGWVAAHLPERPQIVRMGSNACVMGDGGAVLTVDLDTKTLVWAARHQVTVQGQQNMWNGEAGSSSPGSARLLGSTLIFRAANSRHLVGLDLQARKMWSRPVNDRSAVVGANATHVFSFGPGLAMHRRDDGSHIWMRPGEGTGSPHRRLLLSREVLYQLASGAIQELSLRHGGLREKLADTAQFGSGGGDLWRLGDSLITCSGTHVCRVDIPPSPESPKEPKK